MNTAMRLEVIAAYYFWSGKAIADLFLNCNSDSKVELLTYIAKIMYRFQKYRIEATKEMLINAVLRDLTGKK